MKAISLCILSILHPSCCLAFDSQSHAGRRRQPPSSPIGLATSTSSTAIRRRRLTQVSLASSPLEATSTLISLGEVAESLQLFYTAALVAGVGYSQRMAGRQDFKIEMANKIASGNISPEELVDEITVMAEEISNEINESKSIAEAAQIEVQKILDETKAIQQKLQQNIEKAALAIEEEIPVKAPLQEKVLVTAGGKAMPNKEKVLVTAGGRIEGFGVNDDVFEMDELDEEEEKEWSVPVVDHDDETKRNVTADGSEESMQSGDATDTVEEDVGIELIANAPLSPSTTDRDVRLRPSSTDESREVIRQQAEDFRARIKSMESRITSDVTKQAEEKVIPYPKPSPPVSKPPVQVLSSVKNAIENKRIIPDGLIRSSPLARLLCSELGVELADAYPGSGLKGRVLADDVRNYAKSRENTAA